MYRAPVTAERVGNDLDIEAVGDHLPDTSLLIWQEGLPGFARCSGRSGPGLGIGHGGSIPRLEVGSGKQEGLAEVEAKG